MNKRHPDLNYFIAAILPAIIWGFFAIPLRNVRNYSAETILYYRIFLSMALIWAAILIFRRKIALNDWRLLQQLPSRQRRQLGGLVALAVIMLTANWLSFIYVVNAISLQAAAFAYMVCPIITALFAFFFLREEINTRKWIAMGVSVISIVLLSWGFRGCPLNSVQEL